MTTGHAGDSEPEDPPIRFTDNRKIDREHAGGGATTPPPAGPPAQEHEEVPMVEATLLDERTADLQRLQAEYANYRKRAERDRLAAGDVAVGKTLAELLPVIDDIDRARAHGDLTGALKAVADKLDGTFDKLGLVSFGEVGDPFDPAIHEAVLHDESDTVTVPTSTTVMRKGYQYRDRLLRPAMVGVTDPLTLTAPPAEPAESDEDSSANESEATTESIDETTSEPTTPGKHHA